MSTVYTILTGHVNTLVIIAAGAFFMSKLTVLAGVVLTSTRVSGQSRGGLATGVRGGTATLLDTRKDPTAKPQPKKKHTNATSLKSDSTTTSAVL